LKEIIYQIKKKKPFKFLKYKRNKNKKYNSKRRRRRVAKKKEVTLLVSWFKGAFIA
jgi:hypothetical protein